VARTFFFLLLLSSSSSSSSSKASQSFEFDLSHPSKSFRLESSQDFPSWTFYRKSLLAACLTTTLVDWVLCEFSFSWSLRIYVPPEAGWPSYTPRHWVPVLVASYDTHGYGGAILIPGHHTGSKYSLTSSRLLITQNSILYGTCCLRWYQKSNVRRVTDSPSFLVRENVRWCWK
jgi:hypothetical protein